VVSDDLAVSSDPYDRAIVSLLDSTSAHGAAVAVDITLLASFFVAMGTRL
jgi:hypothetical protein